MHLDLELVQLEAAEIVRSTEDGKLMCRFQHALTQDAAYSLLLIMQRRDLHCHVAQTYEELYAERLDGIAALLAQHDMYAGDEVEALVFRSYFSEALYLKRHSYRAVGAQALFDLRQSFLDLAAVRTVSSHA